MQKKIFITVALCLSICTVKAQKIPDSLAQDFRNFLAKNFSMYRTVNLNWETKWAHNYTFTQDGNELEKGFAAIATIKLLLHHSEQLLPCFEEFQQITYENEHLHKQMDEVDFQYEPQILLYQVQASMVPFVRRVYEMYPMLEEERINEFCNRIEATLADLELSQERMMFKTRLIYNFMIEADIRCYEGINEEEE